ncbi:glycolipid transfer protein [Cryphonectria parasitica EP155]|uniref:Glycolipid transfer protein n=1 Tax=Cryphonectria parasitica (strain ATCC 38755 / EP155) TaxID=660469 RepID=A0A9P5CRJ7_CRYP1|nr:glycolipid transfer protein [Cryphonectria parasitica EP155]KAF3767346.1 glycolipid transfer protein [Cryphonectria parasitica EP155]
MADTSVPYFENPAFKKSFADVPIDADNNISTKEFIEATESLVVIFDYLKASAFSPVKSDISGNATKIDTRFKEAPAESATLQDLVKNELKSKKHTATEGLLWLTRGLDFMYQALSANNKNSSEELSVSFTNAYGETLKPHHGFIVKKVFSAAMGFCPKRADFYKEVGKDTPPEKFQGQMDPWLAGLEKIVGILKPFMDSKEAKW